MCYKVRSFSYIALVNIILHIIRLSISMSLRKKEKSIKLIYPGFISKGDQLWAQNMSEECKALTHCSYGCCYSQQESIGGLTWESTEGFVESGAREWEMVLLPQTMKSTQDTKSLERKQKLCSPCQSLSSYCRFHYVAQKTQGLVWPYAPP